MNDVNAWTVATAFIWLIAACIWGVVGVTYSFSTSSRVVAFGMATADTGFAVLYMLLGYGVIK